MRQYTHTQYYDLIKYKIDHILINYTLINNKYVIINIQSLIFITIHLTADYRTKKMSVSIDESICMKIKVTTNYLSSKKIVLLIKSKLTLFVKNL
jgi:hypothetical protein